MERDRSLKAASALAAAMLVLCGGWAGSGCGLLERTSPRSSDDGETPNPFHGPIRIVDVQPSSDGISTAPRLEVTFDGYLEDDTFNTFNTGSLASGALSWGGWADYVVTDKKLVWESRGTIPPGLDVRFSLSDRVEGVTGQPVADSRNIAQFRVEADRDRSDRTRLPAPRWSEVDAVFERECRDCHGDPKWGLVELVPESLVGRKSSQVDRLLVKPYDPADSYLLQKLLWDYPGLRKSPQPPPWSGREELSRRDTLTVERWIEVGAPGPSR